MKNDDDEAGGHDGDDQSGHIALDIGFDLAGKTKEEEPEEDWSTIAPASSEQDDRLWASIRRYGKGSDLNDIIARSPSLE